MPAAATCIAPMVGAYASAGIDLRMEGTPFGASLPFDGNPPVGWTDDDFANSGWRIRAPNPSERKHRIRFDNLPDPHGWTARFFLWALGSAETVQGHMFPARRSPPFAAMSHFRFLVALAERAGKRRLIDLTKEDLQAFLAGHCRDRPRGKPRSRHAVEQVLLSWKQLFLLGPAAGYWIPDGLAFDPESAGYEIIENADLSEIERTAEISEDTARQLLCTAIQWVEEFGPQLLWLRDIAVDFRSWVEARKSGKAYVESEAYLERNRQVHDRYKELQDAFPFPLDFYIFNQKLLPDEKAAQEVIGAVEALRRQTLAEIASDPDPTLGYRSRFNRADLSKKLGTSIDSFLKTSSAGRRVIAACRTDVVDAIGRRRAELGLDPLRLWPGHRRSWTTGRQGERRTDPAGSSELEGFRKVQAQYEGLASTMTGMCYVVVGVFNGWRVSEILSVEEGFLREMAAGFELGSKVRKTGANVDAVAYRPVPPIVAQAVRLLAALNARHFTGGERRLFRNRVGTPSDRHNINNNVHDACKAAGVVEEIDTHQWRRFFAYFYLRRFKGSVDALRRHFRHVSRNMIWAYTQDAANAAYLAKEEAALAREIAEGIVLGEGYRSRHVAQDVRAQYNALNLPLKEAERWLRGRIDELSLRSVYPTPWGYCLFQRGGAGAACEAKDGPVMSRAEPLACGGCKFLASGDENVEFWQSTALLHQEIVATEHHVPLLKDASQRMLRICRAILARHGLAQSTTGEDAEDACETEIADAA